MANMTIKLFEKYAYGIAAMKKMGEVPENFRLYQCGWVGGGQPDQWHGMQCEGAEFRAAKSGPNKGVLSIMIPGTKRSAYVSRAEIDAERDDHDEKPKEERAAS